MSKYRKFLHVLGPGVLFASTAIGVSHLVQSTRAGAEYGFGLLWVVVLANILKFPFFEFGSRYANSTGESIIEGYDKKIGRSSLYIYLLLTLGSMFFVVAAVGLVTSGFVESLWNNGRVEASDQLWLWPLMVFAFCALVLFFGGYRFLDRGIKVVGGILVVSTLVAFVLLWRGSGTDLIPWGTPSFSLASTSLPFIIALMGWMPTAVDLSTWNSIWTVERIRESGYKPSMRETILEFHLGYWISALLAVVFVLIGAIGLYGKQQQFSGSASGFAYQLVELYSTSIGKWARLAIATSAFSIMLGTFIAVLDGYSRSIDHSLQLLKAGKSRYRRILVATTLGGFVVILLTGGRMKFLVDLATTVSFLVAPLIAAGNLYLVTGNRIPRVDQPGKLLRFLAWMGLIFLGMFSFWFVLSSA